MFRRPSAINGTLQPRPSIRARRLNHVAWGALLPACLGLAAPALAQSGSLGGSQGGSDVELVTVTGARLGQELSIDLKKNADNEISAISADDLGKFSDTNVADALARLPGVSVVNNQESGEGEFVTIRGLDATFNSYEVNGIRVATTDPSSRAVSLNVMPPNGMQAITVSKTLTPDMDGDAIGGTIDFRTPTAFDFRDTVARVFLNGGANSRALDQNEPAAALGYQGDFATKFGAGDRFGIYATAYYNYSHYVAEEVENDGDWTPYDYTATETQLVKDNSLELPGVDLDYRRIKETRIGGNFSLDYHATESQLFYIRGQYAGFIRTEDHNYFTIKNNATERLNQVNPDDTSLPQPSQAIVGKTANGQNIYGYTTSQIVDENGDGIITDADRTGSASLYSLIGNSGVFDPESYYTERDYETDNEVSELGTVSVGGSSMFDRLGLVYDAAYSFGKIGNPADYEVDYRSDPTTAPFNSTGISFTFPDPRFPHWQLPPADQYTTTDDSLLLDAGASHETEMTTDREGSAKLDATYKMEGLWNIDYLKAGVEFRTSSRKNDDNYIFDGDLPYANLADASSLILKQVPTILHGEYPFGDIFNMQQVEKQINAMPAQTFTADQQNEDDTRGSETIYAGYVMANLKFNNDIEVIAGVRSEVTFVRNTYWVEDVTSHWAESKHSYTNWLPSLTVNWRPSASTTYRAAIWTSFSRPEYGYISGGSSVTRDPQGNIIAIAQGNPDLKPTESTNFDLSAEYYIDRTSMFSADAFYKGITHFIFTNGNAVNATTPEGQIDVTQPENGKFAKVYGMEFNFMKTFYELPAPLDGFGVAANATVQDSEADTGQAYRAGMKIPLINTSHYLYNIALDYEKYGFELRFAYTFRSKFIEDLRENAIDKWVQPNQNVDIHSRYNFTPDLAVDFDVSNLLDTWRYYTSRGPNPAYQKDYMEPGRTYMAKLSFSY